MDRDAELVPSSPSVSSVSSSDLDTESTGSFFHDRSTSLGTLMGVTFPTLDARPARLPSRREHSRGGGGVRRPEVRSGERRGPRRGGGRGGWWRLCREDAAPTSLGEFLRVERRLGAAAEHEAVGAGPLFANGRVLPPAAATQRQPQKQKAAEAAGSLGRLPVLLTGICSGGEG